ncbi:exosortase K [Desulfosarcina sp. OttesenSCG-928-G10]|nr:exosortase K [Desulfosarcina sp. OttesenSCG-928-G10]MDL2321291.1 exosortase K [Desulfosarcina sp. OttesenSCG-928-B08]
MLKTRSTATLLPMAKILAMGVVIGLTLAVKGWFSGADAIGLDWLLHPVATVVSLVSGISFFSLDTAGYYNAARNILIAPTCSGLNFFLILVATGGCLAICYLPSPARWLAWAPGIVISAYGIGLVVNAIRILLAIFLYQQAFAIGPFTPTRLHRIEGIVIYTVFLWGFAAILSGCLQKARHRTQEKKPAAFFSGYRVPALFSLGCYFLFTLVIPLASGAARKSPELFMEHCLTVFFIGGAVILGGFVIFRKKSAGKHPPLP